MIDKIGFYVLGSLGIIALVKYLGIVPILFGVGMALFVQ